MNLQQLKDEAMEEFEKEFIWQIENQSVDEWKIALGKEIPLEEKMCNELKDLVDSLLTKAYEEGKKQK